MTGQELFRARRKLGLTQVQLGQLLRPDTTVLAASRRISRYECSAFKVPSEVHGAVARLLQAKTDATA